MSISTQPVLRQASLQRAPSSRLSANVLPDIQAVKSTSDPSLHKPDFPSQRGLPSTKAPAAGSPLLTNQQSQGIPTQAQRTISQSESLPVPLATVLAQLQPNQASSTTSEPSKPNGLKRASVSAPAGHSRKRSCPEQGADIRLHSRAQQLQAEYAAMRAGTSSIPDKAAWVTAARQTAHQMQEAARTKVLRAFKAALHHMSEQTLMTRVAAELQLPASDAQTQPAALVSGPDCGVQAPQTFSCPKKARSRRSRRPASAASQGIARMPSLCRPLSAPAERSGWEWAQQLPATTSALLQAVEAAAAEAQPQLSSAPQPTSPPSWPHANQHDPSVPTTSLGLRSVQPHDSAAACAAAEQNVHRTLLSSRSAPCHRLADADADQSAPRAEAAGAMSVHVGPGSSNSKHPLTAGARDASAEPVSMSRAATEGLSQQQPVLRPVVRRASLHSFPAAQQLQELSALAACPGRSSSSASLLPEAQGSAQMAVGHDTVGGNMPRRHSQAMLPEAAKASRPQSEASAVSRLASSHVPNGGSGPGNRLPQLHSSMPQLHSSMPQLQSPFASVAGMPTPPELPTAGPRQEHPEADLTPSASLHHIAKSTRQTFSAEGVSLLQYPVAQDGSSAHGLPPADSVRAVGSSPTSKGRSDTALVMAVGRGPSSQHQTSSHPAAPHAVENSQQHCAANSAAAVSSSQVLPLRSPLSPCSSRPNAQAGAAQTQGRASASAGPRGRKGSCAQPEEASLAKAVKAGLVGKQPLAQTELLPGRNVILAASCQDDLAQLQLVPSQWCWVARIDRVLAMRMKVSWYGKHNGRWTLARYAAGPDEGQVCNGDVSLSDYQVLAVFDRFTGSKEVPADVLMVAAARLAARASNQPASDQENIATQPAISAEHCQST